MQTFAETNPSLHTFVYDGAPAGFHDWGVIAGWNLVHHEFDWPALWSGSPDGQAAVRTQTVAYGAWDQRSQQLTIVLRPPD